MTILSIHSPIIFMAHAQIRKEISNMFMYFTKSDKLYYIVGKHLVRLPMIMERFARSVSYIQL